jgi:branched-chain amino acid transport system ATP-binding protein
LSVALEVTDLTAGWGSVVILEHVSVQAREGGFISILGANGAGKTTLLRTIMGQTRIHGGSIAAFGEPIARKRTYEIVGHGVVLVPDDRGLVPFMTVEDNLRMGLDVGVRSAAGVSITREYIDELFPILQNRGKQLAGSLSGGEQQALAVARALLMQPRCLLLDEPSHGLSPNLIDRMFETLQRIREDLALTVVLVEQLVEVALRLSEFVYVLDRGRIVREGAAELLKTETDLHTAYLG